MAERYFEEDEEQLQRLFRDYRDACPVPEAGADFMPVLWSRIDARRTFSFAFGRFGRSIAAASAVLCLLLAVLNLVSGPQMPASYTDALVSDYSAEQTYYTEAIRATPPAAAEPGIPR